MGRHHAAEELPENSLRFGMHSGADVVEKLLQRSERLLRERCFRMTEPPSKQFEI